SGPTEYYLRIAASLVAFVTGLWWFFLALRLRRRLAPHDYLAFALLLGAIVYFQKFLWRADVDHLQQGFMVSGPVIFYMAGRAFSGHLILSRALFGLLILATGPTIVHMTDAFPIRISHSMRPAEASLRLGYVHESAGIEETVRALRPLISTAHGS